MPETPPTRISIDQLEVACRIGGEGPPVVLLHGAEGDHRVYDRLQDRLAAFSRAISFDQRDCGQTRFTGPEPSVYALEDVAADAVKLLDALEIERAVFFGISLGGLLAQIVAVHWPERVARLVLGLTWPGDTTLGALNPEVLKRREALSRSGDAAPRLMAELFTTPAYAAAHPEIVAVLADLQTMPTETARARRRRALAEVKPIDPARITAPVLLIAGEEDQLVPPSIVAGFKRPLPTATMVTLPGVGHLAAIQAPDLLASHLKDFLDGQ